MSVSITIASVAHFDLFSGIFLVQQVSMELRYSLLISVLVVLADQHLFLQFLTKNETTEHRLHLLGNDLLPCYDLSHSRNKKNSHQYQHHRCVSDTIVVPGLSVDRSYSSNINHKKSSYRKQVSYHYEDIVTDFSISQKRNHVQRVQDLCDYHYDAGNLRRFEQSHKGNDNDSSGNKGNYYIIFSIPSLGSHLFEKYIIMRVIYLKAFPVASHQQSDHHNHDLYQCQNRQYKSKSLEFCISANCCHLEQAGEEEHVENERDDASGKDNLLPSDQNSSGAVWDAIHYNQQQPEYAQQNHHHYKLRSKGVRKTVIPDHTQVCSLQRKSSTFESISPRDQRYKLNILKDIAINSLAHCKHEQVHAGDDDSDGYKWRQSGRWLRA